MHQKIKSIPETAFHLNSILPDKELMALAGPFAATSVLFYISQTSHLLWKFLGRSERTK